MIGMKLANELSETEDIQLNKWLQQDPANQQMFETLKKGWEVKSPQQIREQEDQLFSKVVQGIGKKEFEKYSSRWSFGRILKYAAAISLLVVATFGIWKNTILVEDPVEIIALNKKVTQKGQKSTIHLPDGSKVVLNSGSELTYPDAFETGTREILLKGEAYFDVAKNPDQPFVVKTEGVSIMALGTEFNVHTRNERVDVGLTEGKVQVSMLSDLSQYLILEPGQMASLNKAENKFSKSNFSIEEVTSWKDGNLIFVDASMGEVFSILEMWYGVDIEIQNFHSHTWNYNGEFKNEHMDRVLMNISFSQNFEYEIKDKKVIIKPKDE